MIISATPLVEVCRSIGIAADLLAAVEDAARFAHEFEVDGPQAAALDPVAAQHAVAAYGAALRIEMRIGGLSELTLRPGVTADEITAFTAMAADEGPFQVSVEVDKAELVVALAGGGLGAEVCLFLFAGGLTRALARGSARFEQEVWPPGTGPLVIAVADTDVDLRGPHLAVLGGSSLAHVATIAAGPVSPPPDVQPILDARDRHVSWEGSWATRLTPCHYALAGECQDEALAQWFRTHLVTVLILFTCDRARSRPDTGPPPFIAAEFRGADQMVTVVIDESRPMPITEEQADAAVQIFDWCYARAGAEGEPDWVADRLPFVQARLAYLLQGAPEDQRHETLVRVLPMALEGVEWQWKGFISGRVDEYLSQIQKVEGAVADVVTSFADRSAALAKGVVDTMLAALAVVVGSLIAAAFKAPFNATLFRVGVIGYGIYVIVFPGAIGLTSSRYGFAAERHSFDSRIGRLSRTLDPAKVEAVVGNRVDRAQTGFRRWLVLCAVLYSALSVAAFIGAAIIPGAIQNDPAEAPATTSTTTTTVAPTTATGRPPQTTR